MIKMLEVKVGQCWTPAPNYFKYSRIDSISSTQQNGEYWTNPLGDTFMSLIRVRDIFTLKYPEYWIFVGLECVKCHKLCSQRCEVL